MYKALFLINNHSVGGDTGSGLGALILERMAVDYVTSMTSFRAHKQQQVQCLQ